MKTKDYAALRPVGVGDGYTPPGHAYQENSRIPGTCLMCGARRWAHGGRVNDHVTPRPVGVGDAKLRSGVSVVTCPKCTREVVSKNGVIQPHADMKKGGWCGGAKAKDSSVADPLAKINSQIAGCKKAIGAVKQTLAAAEKRGDTYRAAVAKRDLALWEDQLAMYERRKASDAEQLSHGNAMAQAAYKKMQAQKECPNPLPFKDQMPAKDVPANQVFTFRDGAWKLIFNGVVANAEWNSPGAAKAQLELLENGYSTMLPGGAIKHGARAKDSSVTGPLAALALLLWIVRKYAGPTDADRAAEANWDLTRYRPAPREW